MVKKIIRIEFRNKIYFICEVENESTYIVESEGKNLLISEDFYAFVKKIHDLELPLVLRSLISIAINTYMVNKCQKMISLDSSLKTELYSVIFL